MGSTTRPGIARTVLKGCVILVASMVLYAWHLDRLYLVHDEVIYALNAHAIATTWRDLSGQFLPISLPVVGTFFATPMSIYFTALLLKFAPLTEVMVRLPSVVIGVSCIGLVFLVGRQVFKKDSLAALAAGMLALTPAHFIHSRLGTDHLYTVVLMLGWLLCLLGVTHERQVRRIALASALLGLGVYSYLGALITMPVCFVITIAVLYRMGFRTPAPYLAAVIGAGLPVLPFVAWHLVHPDQYVRQMQMYGLVSPALPGPADSAQQLAGYSSVVDRVAVYWDYFNPSLLFFAGDTGLINGTRYSGVFLWPLMVLLPAGVYRLVVHQRSTAGWLLVVSLAASPLAATLVAERYKINRALVMLPLAALVATAGVEMMWGSRHRVWRACAIVLIAAMPWQFTRFYRDYFVDYPGRSYTWFEYNIRGGMEDIIARQRDGAPVFIANNIQWADYYWPFYLAKQGRQDLRTVTTYLDVTAPGAVASMPPGGILLCRVADVGAMKSAGLRELRAITEPDGSQSFAVMQR